MFNATVACTSNQKFRSDKLAGVGDECADDEESGLLGRLRTPLYLCTVLIIILGTILCIIYAAMGGLQ